LPNRKYQAYQFFKNNQWQVDQLLDFRNDANRGPLPASLSEVEPNIVIKKKDGKRCWVTRMAGKVQTHAALT